MPHTGTAVMSSSKDESDENGSAKCLELLEAGVGIELLRCSGLQQIQTGS